MMGGAIDADVLRRHFVALATSTYQDPTLPNLPGVHEEVETLTRWLCDKQLGDRRFTPKYTHLSDNPTKCQVREAFENPDTAHKWRQTDAAVLFITGHGIPGHSPH